MASRYITRLSDGVRMIGICAGAACAEFGALFKDPDAPARPIALRIFKLLG
ncbi:MAG: hypothetical protein O3B37_10435 [Proteobacteria bacterium]|nr:hypothetical protein [Pseudomonadota bacterium]